MEEYDERPFDETFLHEDIQNILMAQTYEQVVESWEENNYIQQKVIIDLLDAYHPNLPKLEQTSFEGPDLCKSCGAKTSTVILELDLRTRDLPITTITTEALAYSCVACGALHVDEESAQLASNALKEKQAQETINWRNNIHLN